MSPPAYEDLETFEIEVDGTSINLKNYLNQK